MSVQEQRRASLSIEDIIRGARGMATDVYDEVIKEVRERSVAGRQCDDPNEYAEVVAFNAGLAAEAMLESNGELVTAPLLTTLRRPP